MFERLKNWARVLKRDIVALWLAARDPRVPVLAKAVAGGVAAYAFSPVDLIPDFIPVIGYLDDLIVVPFGILLAVRLVPETVMTELRARAAEQVRPLSKGGLVIIILLWVVLAVVALWLALR